MPTPTPIGRIHYDEPRGVLVRDTEVESGKHSAVHSGVSVYVDSKTQADLIIQNWPEFMSRLDSIISDFIFEQELKTGM